MRPTAPSTSPAVCITRPGRASGFCYVNDPVLAILRLREHGLRVAYVDIDAHHGDGVQYAFYDDPNVLTVSTHERGERLFPGTGFVRELGEGDGAGFSVNLPLEAYTDSAVYLPAFESVVPPLLERFKPDVIVAQLGIDAHRTDPLTHLALDMQGFAKAFTRLLPLAPKIVALGGGGYDIRNVAKAWTIAWSILSITRSSPQLPESFAPDIKQHNFESRQLWDSPAAIPEAIGRAVETTSTAKSTPSKRRSSLPPSLSVRTGRRSRIGSSRPGLRGRRGQGVGSVDPFPLPITVRPPGGAQPRPVQHDLPPRGATDPTPSPAAPSQPE